MKPFKMVINNDVSKFKQDGGYSLQASAREYQYESSNRKQERLFVPLSESLSFL